MVSGVGGTKPSALSPFFFHLYKATECLDEEEVRYYKTTRVDEAYGFEDSDEESKEDGAEETGAAGSGPSALAPPEQVTPEPKKTKRKKTPKSNGGTREIKKNANGEDCGFDLCTQTVENIQGMATLMNIRGMATLLRQVRQGSCPRCQLPGQPSGDGRNEGLCLCREYGRSSGGSEPV